jgi:hypothetical protein
VGTFMSSAPAHTPLSASRSFHPQRCLMRSSAGANRLRLSPESVAFIDVDGTRCLVIAGQGLRSREHPGGYLRQTRPRFHRLCSGHDVDSPKINFLRHCKTRLVAAETVLC